jgi:hypothetical protein
MTAAAQPNALDVDLATTVLAERGLTIAGRTFVVSPKPTVKQRAYMHKWRAASGVDEMMKHFDPAKDERVSDFVESLIIQSFENDAIFHLLAGGLVPVVNGAPAKWDYKTAESLARFFGDLEEEADQEALNKAILGVLSSFFLLRIVSDAASRSSLEDTPANPISASDPTTGTDLGPERGALDEAEARRQSDAARSPAPWGRPLEPDTIGTVDDREDPSAISAISTK